jgi:hypothetical protein
MLRRFLLVLVLACAAFSPLAPLPQTLAAEQPSGPKKDCTVYVTRTGHKYHKATCGSIKRSKIPMSRSEAIKKGFTPCKRCGGSDCEK